MTEDLHTRKLALRDTMRRITDRLSPRINACAYGQSVEAMKDALFYCYVDAKEALNLPDPTPPERKLISEKKVPSKRAAAWQQFRDRFCPPNPLRKLGITGIKDGTA